MRIELIVVAVFSMSAVLPNPVRGEPAAVDRASGLAFDLPARPLGEALDAYAKQAAVQIMYDARLVAGRTAPTVSGRMTKAEALDRLLAASGLTSRHVGRDVVVITRRAEAAHLVLRPLEVEARAVIGGGPDAEHRAYANAVVGAMTAAVRSGPSLRNAEFVLTLTTRIGRDGALIECAATESPTNAGAMVTKVVQSACSARVTPPPPGLPAILRIELRGRPTRS